MKKNFFLLSAAIFALSFTACDDDDDKIPTSPGETTEAYINANSSTVWQYYSFAKNETIGSAEGNTENDAEWAKRKDWDIAIRRMYIRTNSGTSTSVGANGGVSAFTGTANFSSVVNVPATTVFASDAVVTYTGMGGDITTSQSNAVVVGMKKDENGDLIMPPIYLKTPGYIFRTAGGENYYKVEFTQYADENSKPGHVKFNMAQIYPN